MRYHIQLASKKNSQRFLVCHFLEIFCHLFERRFWWEKSIFSGSSHSNSIIDWMQSTDHTICRYVIRCRRCGLWSFSLQWIPSATSRKCYIHPKHFIIFIIWNNKLWQNIVALDIALLLPSYNHRHAHTLTMHFSFFHHPFVPFNWNCSNICVIIIMRIFH